MNKIDLVNDFINYHGDLEEFGHERVEYANNVSDVVDWILNDRVSSDDFLGENYIDIPLLEKLVKKIEARTGEKLEDYKKIYGCQF